MFLVVFIGHNPGKNPLSFATGRPVGGTVIATFTFWPLTFESN